MTAKIAEIGENLIVGQNVCFKAQDVGAVVSYIHLGGKVGVLLELGCGKADSVQSAAFQEAAKDITLHIAACHWQDIHFRIFQFVGGRRRKNDGA